MISKITHFPLKKNKYLACYFTLRNLYVSSQRVTNKISENLTLTEDIFLILVIKMYLFIFPYEKQRITFSKF